MYIPRDVWPYYSSWSGAPGAPGAPKTLTLRILGALGAPGALGATDVDRSKVKEQLTKGKVIFAINILFIKSFSTFTFVV